MFRNVVRSSLFVPALWVLTTGLANLVLAKYWDLDATRFLVIGVAMWTFVGLTALYVRLDHSIAMANAGAALAKHPELQKTVLHAVAIYDSIEQPLLREVVKKQIVKFNDHEFSPGCSLRLTHQEFGYWLAPYIESSVTELQAFSKSWVTNWKKFGAASDRYLHAQGGKSVARIFVLEDANDYEYFATKVFPAHAAVYGAANILVISKQKARAIVRELPSGVAEDEDFAIFDDSVVAFCKGEDVRVRVDKLDICRTVFREVRRYAVTYESLKADAAQVEAVFKTTAAT